MQKQFQDQLLKVKDEFQALTKEAADETAKLQSRITELEEDLAGAQAAKDTNSAGKALEHKKELDKIKADYEDKLKKMEKKLEKVQKQFDDLQAKSGSQAQDLDDLQTELKEAKKENTQL